jgi:hypothetical protein
MAVVSKNIIADFEENVMPFVYSTATASVDYTFFHPPQPGANVGRIKKKITIQGGANLADRKNCLITPQGFVTKVTDEELEMLESNFHFCAARDAGFHVVSKSNKTSVENMIENMVKKDGSAPKTPDDPEFQKGRKRQMNRGNEDLMMGVV